MRNIMLIVKNNLYRISREKVTLVFMFIITPIVIFMGAYLSKTDTIKGKIAVVGADSIIEQTLNESFKVNDKISMVFLEEEPTKTELIKGVYLAEIDFREEEPKVISYGKEEIKKTLEALLKGETYEVKENFTTPEGKIIGFLVMFLLMGSTMILDGFLTDREEKVYNRVLTGNISFYEYILGQLAFLLSLLLVPLLIFSLIIVNIVGVNLSVSTLGFIGLITLGTVLSATCSLCVCTLCKTKQSANMTGSAVVMITSVLAGSLVNVVDTNKIIGFFRNCLPQKRIIDLANSYNVQDFIFVIATIVICIIITIGLGKRQYENGDFI